MAHMAHYPLDQMEPKWPPLAFSKRKKVVGGKQGQNGEKQGLTTPDLTLPITIMLEQTAGG